MLRRRNVGIKAVKELDAFPKVTENCTDKSAVGGTFSVITFIVIGFVIVSETMFFLDSRLMFKFEPDTEIEEKLKLNIDMTVAMTCSRIGADVLDATNQNLNDFATDELAMDDTWWILDTNQRAQFDGLKDLNSYLREEYHAIHKYLWKNHQFSIFNELPERTEVPNHAADACRVHGSLNVNKVAGNFHITAGKSLTLHSGHAHFSAFMTFDDYNFTHRINKFSFGDNSHGIIHPLDGDEKIAEDPMMLYQYFVEVVATDVHTLLHKSKTFQYSVKDHARPVNHNKGSHGIPGIFFKYDTSALKVKVIEKREKLIKFLVRLCASTGGIFVTSGLIHSVIQAFWCIACCKFFRATDSKDDQKLLISETLVSKDSLGPIDLVNVPTPLPIDVTLHAQ